MSGSVMENTGKILTTSVENSKTSTDVGAGLGLVLVGSQRYGVNSVANGILGGTSFEWDKRTSQSKSQCAEVKCKSIQLVKAPVWLRSYHLCDTAQMVKDEMVLSVSRCQHGPHAFLLLVEVDLPFTSACARAVKEHLELYGEHVWNHTIVLFTCGDWLYNTTIEKYISGEGKDLAELLSRCGQRYVLDSTATRPALTQSLLEKVDALLKTNGHFQPDGHVLQKIVQHKEEVNKRAEKRKERRLAERRQDMAGVSLSEVTIVLLGWVFSVKTKVSNAILDTPLLEQRTETCVKTTKVLENGLKVTVVDTPGWWKFFSASLVPKSIRCEIMKALDEETGPTSASARGFLLMIPTDTSFTNEQKKIIEDNMKPFGESIWQNTMVVFTRAHWLGDLDIEQHIESEGEALIWLVERCGNRYFVFNDYAKSQSELRTMGLKLVDMVVDMVSHSQHFQMPSNDDQQNPEEEGPVDEDLKKMVEVFHRAWGWGSWETAEYLARFDERPMAEVYDKWSMTSLVTFKKMSHTREEVEKILREELGGKSREEVLEIALQMYFRRECGAFDILSIVFEEHQFKSEWKKLFEREWARREVRLMEYVFEKYMKIRADSDDAQKISDENVMKWLNQTPSSNWMDGLPSFIKEPARKVLNRLEEIKL